MSVEFSLLTGYNFEPVLEEAARIGERFMEIAAVSHVVELVVADRDWLGRPMFSLRMCKRAVNGQQPMAPHAGMNEYDDVNWFRYKLSDNDVVFTGHISTTATTNQQREAVIHPLVDMLARVLLEEFNANYFQFVSGSYHDEGEVTINPCSRETLEYLLLAPANMAISMGPAPVGGELTRAFATSSCSPSKQLNLVLDRSNILDYDGFGQSLGNNRNLQALTIAAQAEHKIHHILPLLQGLASHPTLEHLSIGGVWRRSPADDHLNELWEALSRIRVTSFSVVEILLNMHGREFRGIWNALAQHPTITKIRFSQPRSSILTAENVEVMTSALRANSRILEVELEITDFRERDETDWRDQFNLAVMPLLEKNRLNVPIQELLRQSNDGVFWQQAGLLALLANKRDAVPSLYQILRSTVAIWVPLRKPAGERPRRIRLGLGPPVAAEPDARPDPPRPRRLEARPEVEGQDGRGRRRPGAHGKGNRQVRRRAD